MHVLRERGSPDGWKRWAALGVTKQDKAHILAPHLKAKLVRRLGTHRNGRYVLA